MELAKAKIPEEQIPLILSSIYQELVVPYPQFATDPLYLGKGTSIFPNLLMLESYIESDPTIHKVFLTMGKSSGKSALCSRFLLRGVYKILCYWDAHEYLGVPDDYIGVINLSISSVQAKLSIFKKLHSYLQKSPWFKSRFVEQREQVLFGDSILAICGNSKGTGWQGFPVYYGVIDEANFLLDKKEKRIAEDMVSVLEESGKTRFPLDYKIIIVSSARAPNDYMDLETKRIAKKGDKIDLPLLEPFVEVDGFPLEVYRDGSEVAVIGPTWAWNPRLTYASFKEDFDKKPDNAARAYGSRPKVGIRPFFTDPSVIERKAVKDGTLKHPFDEKGHLYPWFQPRHDVTYFLHMDMSAKHDSTGRALCHKEGGKYVVDLMQRVTPPEGGQLLLVENRALITELFDRGFDINVSFDSWQCKPGWLEVPLLNGKIYTMEELASGKAGPEFWLYSHDGLKYKPAQGRNAHYVGEMEVFEIVLDNGEKIGLSAEDGVMMRNGVFRRVSELKVGDSLMPLYRYVEKAGWSKNLLYEQIIDPDNPRLRSNSTRTHIWVAECVLGPKPGGRWVVHHKDFNGLNNDPDNLEYMSWKSHSIFHNKVLEKRWTRESRLKQSELMVGYNREFKEAFDRARVRAGETRKQTGVSSEDLKQRWANPVYKEKMRIVRSVQMRERWRATPNWKKDSIASKLNHKVVLIRSVGIQPVFDLEVLSTGCFGVKAGVFVHNSLELLQFLQMRDIPAEVYSTDRTPEAYETTADLLYQGKVAYYPSPDLLSEAFDLVRTESGKIDHSTEGCLSGDTRIPLLNGTVSTLKELEGKKNFWVYSINRGGKVVPGKVKVCLKTGVGKDVWGVVLDNGVEVRATPDHRFMMRSGEYKRVDNLVCGDSLMPFYNKKKVRGAMRAYELYYEPTEGSYRFTHKMVLRGRGVWKVPEGLLVHHVNWVKRDNSPKNLKVMTKSEHRKIHNLVMTEEGRERKRNSLKESWAKERLLRVECVKCKRLLSPRCISRHLCLEGRDGLVKCGVCGFFMKRRNVGRHEVICEESKMKRFQGISIAHKAGKYVNAAKALQKFNLSVEGREIHSRTMGRLWTEGVLNHKVVAVVFRGAEDVYDLEVEKYGNFAVDEGVFVHNSKDLWDAFVAAVTRAFKDSPEDLDGTVVTAGGEGKEENLEDMDVDRRSLW